MFSEIDSHDKQLHAGPLKTPWTIPEPISAYMPTMPGMVTSIHPNAARMSAIIRPKQPPKIKLTVKRPDGMKAP